MKKTIVCMMSIMMVAVMTACGSEKTGNQKVSGGTDSITASTDAETERDRDVQERESDSTETESDEGVGQMPDDAAVGSESRESEKVNAVADSGPSDTSEEKDNMEDNTMKITAGNTTFTAVLADNSSVEALKELLAEGPLTINMSDYANMEKVGPIGTALVRNDEQITTGAGDIILYQGNSLAIYYDTNSWNFTRIGKINDVTREELLEAFGDGDVTVTFSLQ